MRAALDLRLFFDLCLDMIDTFNYTVGDPEIDYNKEMEKLWDPLWAIK